MDALGMTRELHTLLAHTDMRGQFLANHASNHLPMTLRLPRDRDFALAKLDAALAGEALLKADRRRGL